MKKSLVLLGLSTLWVSTTLAISHPAPHVVHETRQSLPSYWFKRPDTLNGDFRIPMRIGLTQSNLHKGHDLLMDVSSPHSSNYGKHYTRAQITELFAPSNKTVKAVQTWLTESGIDEARITISRSQNWLKFEATVAEAEGLLRTKYNVYEHDSGATHIGCDSYQVPKHVQEHVDFIVPTLHIDAHVEKRGSPLRKRDTSPGGARRGPVPLVQAGAIVENLPEVLNSKPTRLDLCDSYIFPECLQALYQIPIPNGRNPNNSYGIVEYTPQAFVQKDLDIFLSTFNPVASGSSPEFKTVDGGDAILSGNFTGFDANGESDLDLQYAATLVYPQPVTLYQVGDVPEQVNNSFNNFLDAIDGSYCTFEGGDDPEFDALYPDPNPGGYKSHDCGLYQSAKVISTSYGYNEDDLTPKYASRQCAEYMKLGMQGVTMVFSSGDNGVAGNGNICLGANGTRFNPDFPSTCPYVTAVGATQIVPNATVTQPEVACETIISSGGGFSNVFPMPDYQSEKVKKYLAESAPALKYNSTQFNNTGNARAFPDISANGANYLIILDGTPQKIYGTSASGPVIGAIFSLINGERMDAGKAPIGFVNPTLYAHPDAFNDIVGGKNPGCGTPGFAAVKGWDPLTGMGTPIYSRLRDVFMNLPAGH